MEVNVLHDKENQKFYAVINGKEAHLIYMILPDNVINFHHTYVPNELRGQGIAAKVVKAGLEYAKGNNFKVIPSCSYVDTYVERHAEYKDLVK